MIKRRPGRTGNKFSPKQDAVSETASQLLASVEIVIRRLADSLIDLDLPVAELERVARKAYTTAAAGRARRQNGTINRSLVSAITGIARQEVTKILASDLEMESSTKTNSSRARRIIAGWTTDHRFRAGTAKAVELDFSGRGNTFTKLVRLYGSDVPPRAMLAQLRNLGLVQVIPSSDGRVDRVKLAKVGRRPSDTSSEPNFIGAICRLLEAENGAISDARLLSTTIEISDEARLIAIIRAAEEKGRHFMDGTRAALQEPDVNSTSGQLQLVLGLVARRGSNLQLRQRRSKGKVRTPSSIAASRMVRNEK